MKIKIIRKTYEEVVALPQKPRKKPQRPNVFFRTLVRLLSCKDLIPTGFKCDKADMKRAGRGPYLILMNHSCFLDMEIASGIFYPMPYGIVATTDAFVGKDWLMRQLGCIETQKFISDLKLIPMVHAGWLRYLMAIDDEGNAFEPSPDPLLDTARPYVADFKVGEAVSAEEAKAKLEGILRNTTIFGVDLIEVGLADLVCQYFVELIAGKGAVRATLKKYLAEA